MSYFKKVSVKKIICFVLVMALCVTAITVPENKKLLGDTRVSVFDEIEKTDISKEQAMEISEEALIDGEKTAEKINQYTDMVDYEAAVNYALTSYYENEEFGELEEFEKNIDNRSDEIVEGYKEAARERTKGDLNEYEVGTVLVAFNKDATKEEIEAVVEAEYGECEEIIKLFNDEYLATVSISLGQTVDMATEAYSDYSITDVVAPNDYMEVADSGESTEITVNDTLINKQYYLDNIKAKEAWDYISEREHKKVLVGVIDTGVQLDHGELQDVISPYSADVTKSSTPVLLSDCETTYTSTHGTKVAGVIAAKANNSTKIAGVASCYNNDVVEMLAVQTSTYNASLNSYRFSIENFTRAMNYCIEKGTKVINYSVGGGYNSLYESIIKNATNQGVIFVCSAGNNATEDLHYPSDIEEAIGVMSTDSNNNLSSFTNYGMKKDICAPGSAILTTNVNNSYATANGTSLASPIITAVAAMMCSLNDELGYLDVKRILAETSVDIGIGNKCRNGLVDAAAAVKKADGYNSNSWITTNVSKGKPVTVSSSCGSSFYSLTNIVDGMDKTSWISDSESEHWVIVDLQDKYMIDNIDIIYAGEIGFKLKILASDNGSDWSEVRKETKISAYTENIQTSVSRARYIKFNYRATNPNTAITVREIKVWGKNIEGETIITPTTTVSATTTQQQTTTDVSNTPLEVIGLVVSNPADNTVGVVWGQDSARIESGCRYNVYVNGVKYLSEVACNYYTISGVNAGEANVRVTAVLDGVESDGVTLNVNVNGTATETTTQAVTTTETVNTTVEETTSNDISETNIALNKTVYSSSNENDSVDAPKAFDGDMSTRWSLAWADNQWVYVDLGENYNVAKVKVFWEAAFATQFKIQVSTDAANWQDVATLGDTYCKDYDVEFTPVNARYVRMLGITRGTEYGFSIYEMEVYATEKAVQTDNVLLSQGKTAVASSSESDELVAKNVIDGDLNTRWSSAWTDQEWIYIDLWENKYVSYVEFDWEAAYATTYQVLISDNGTNWKIVNNITNGQGGKERVDIGQNARYVKMQGANRSTTYGYSLYEMSVYGY